MADLCKNLSSRWLLFDNQIVLDRPHAGNTACDFGSAVSLLACFDGSGQLYHSVIGDNGNIPAAGDRIVEQFGFDLGGNGRIVNKLTGFLTGTGTTQQTRDQNGNNDFSDK